MWLLTFLQDDVRMMREIEQFYSTQIEEMPMFVPDHSHYYCRIADNTSLTAGTLRTLSK